MSSQKQQPQHLAKIIFISDHNSVSHLSRTDWENPGRALEIMHLEVERMFSWAGSEFSAHIRGVPVCIPLLSWGEWPWRHCFSHSKTCLLNWLRGLPLTGRRAVRRAQWHRRSPLTSHTCVYHHHYRHGANWVQPRACCTRIPFLCCLILLRKHAV